MAVVWLTVARSAVREAQELVDRSVRQLSLVRVSGLRSAQIRYAAIARDTNVLAALRAPDATRAFFASAALERLATPGDSGMPIELWTAAGRRVTFVGRERSEPIALRAGSEEGRPQPVVHPGLDSLRAIDSVQLGSLYRVGDRTFYWLVMPILVDGTMVGFISQERRVAVNPQNEQTIRELSGDSATGYYHNVDGTAWTTFGGEAASPPDVSGPTRSDWTRSGIGRIIHAERRIGHTQLVLTMEIPRGVVVARATNLVNRLALFSILLTLIAALAAWLAGRRVARPLTRLTSAAESIARGDFTAWVSAEGSEEVARLASAFNRMAGHIGESLSMLEARETDLRTLANAIPQLAWMADAQGDVFWLNERWHDYTGSANGGAETPATLWAEAHDPAVLPQVLRRWRASVISGEPFEMEVLLRARSGQTRWFLTRVAPVCDREGHVTRWFGTSTDVQTLWEARKAAEAGNRAKSDFLAAMSHELRTPLNAIGGYAELLEMGVRGPISDEQRHDLRRIRASQTHLLGLIGSLLDLTRIESGRVTYKTISIDIDPFLATVEGLVRPQITARQQTLTCHVADVNLAVLADEEKLRQILLNLLSNAVRHCPTGAAITITAVPREEATALADIMVNDTGPGIPIERHESIFEPFVQLGRSLTNPTEGIGLGLAISRDLARGMGGDLTVASDVGAGSCFTLTLPTRVPSLRSKVPASPSQPAVARAAVEMH
jgi:signal transduction histidine kinase